MNRIIPDMNIRHTSPGLTHDALNPPRLCQLRPVWTVKLACALALVVLSLLATSVSAADVVIALKPDKNPEAMAKERTTLGAHLASKLGGPVQVIVPTSGAVIQEGLANGTIDLAYLSGSDLVQVLERKTGSLLLAGEIDGKTSYESLWVAKAGTTWTSIAELKGHPVAFTSRTSTSGFVVPRLDLVDRGLIPAEPADPAAFFGPGNVSFGTGYVSAIERVLSGQADAAAVSDYVILKDKHLTPEQKAKLRIVQRQGPVPTHVIAVRAGLDAALTDRLRAALQGLDADAPALRDQVFGCRFVVADAASHLAVIRRALALPKLP